MQSRSGRSIPWLSPWKAFPYSAKLDGGAGRAGAAAPALHCAQISFPVSLQNWQIVDKPPTPFLLVRLLFAIYRGVDGGVDQPFTAAATAFVNVMSNGFSGLGERVTGKNTLLAFLCVCKVALGHRGVRTLLWYLLRPDRDRHEVVRNLSTCQSPVSQRELAES